MTASESDSDFDGIPNTPEGLDGVDKYPALFAELARRGWSDEDMGKLAGGNILRVHARGRRGGAALFAPAAKPRARRSASSTAPSKGWISQASLLLPSTTE